MSNYKGDKEIWVDIKGYEGIYQCSNYGRVRSLDRVVVNSIGVNNNYNGKILTGRLTGPDRRQYLNVRLYKNGVGKEYRVHKLIFENFKHICKSGYVIDHIDNNSLNNNLSNLQCITIRDNNSKDKSGYSSDYVGVHRNSRGDRWVAAISIKGVPTHIGTFKSEIEASEAYQKALDVLFKSEKHYTNEELLDEMFSLMNKYHPNPTEILENSAGSGNMIDYLKSKLDCNIIAYDILNETKREDIKECNYLKEKIDYKEGRLAFINPPFTKGLKFVYKALEECDRVIAILSQNSLINLDYDKYYLEEGQLWRGYDFDTCKVSICIIVVRKKRDGDSYDG